MKCNSYIGNSGFFLLNTYLTCAFIIWITSGMSGSECVNFMGNPLFLLQPHDKEVTVVTCLQSI